MAADTLAINLVFSNNGGGFTMTIALDTTSGAVVPYAKPSIWKRLAEFDKKLRKRTFLTWTNFFIDIFAGSIFLAFFGLYAPGKPMYELGRLVYGEARGEPLQGQKAVVATVMHRTVTKYGQFSVSGMDYIMHEKNGNSCMYVAMCDDIPEDVYSREGIVILIRTTLWFLDFQLGLLQKNDPSKGSEWFCEEDACSKNVFFKNYKKKKLEKTVKIGRHQFFRKAAPSEPSVVSAPIPPAKPR